MSTLFDRAENAKDYGIIMAGVDPQKTEVIEDDSLGVQSAGGFLSDQHTPEGREQIVQDLQGQKGYRFRNKDGVEVAIVVAPFREGFCVWGIVNGMAIRF